LLFPSSPTAEEEEDDEEEEEEEDDEDEEEEEQSLSNNNETWGSREDAMQQTKDHGQEDRLRKRVCLIKRRRGACLSFEDKDEEEEGEERICLDKNRSMSEERSLCTKADKAPKVWRIKVV